MQFSNLKTRTTRPLCPCVESDETIYPFCSRKLFATARLKLIDQYLPASAEFMRHALNKLYLKTEFTIYTCRRRFHTTTNYQLHQTLDASDNLFSSLHASIVTLFASQKDYDLNYAHTIVLTCMNYCINGKIVKLKLYACLIK